MFMMHMPSQLPVNVKRLQDFHLPSYADQRHKSFVQDEDLLPLLYELDQGFTIEAYSFLMGDQMNKKRKDYDLQGVFGFEPVPRDSCFDYDQLFLREPSLDTEDVHIKIPEYSNSMNKRKEPGNAQQFATQQVKRHKPQTTKPRRTLKKKTTSEFKAAALQILKAEVYLPKNEEEKKQKKEDKKPKIQPCVKYVPEFIVSELTSTSGEGRFTTAELLCCILFAYTESLKQNSYATIKSLMGEKRSRGSIRRKIEKIVKRDTGINGGLLGIDSANQELVLQTLWQRFMRLLNETEANGSSQDANFAKRLRSYAMEHCKRSESS